MTGVEIVLVMFAALLLLLLVRVPIAVAMLLVGMVTYTILTGWEPLLNWLKTSAYYRFSSYSLSVVPLFLLMGQFASKAGMSRALFDAANVWLGHRRGGIRPIVAIRQPRRSLRRRVEPQAVAGRPVAPLVGGVASIV